jgi:hypothetical protein
MFRKARILTGVTNDERSDRSANGLSVSRSESKLASDLQTEVCFVKNGASRPRIVGDSRDQRNSHFRRPG